MSSSSLLKPCPISRQDSLLSPNHMTKEVLKGNYSRSASSMTSSGMQKQHRNYYYENYSGGGIEFRAHNTDAEEQGGVTSPPLWKTSPCTSPPAEKEETTPLHSSNRHHHYRLLSPASRSQAIARGRQELMEMVKNMPESSYELSLKDLVDQSRVQGGYGQSSHCVDQLDTELADDSSFTIHSGKKKKMLRSESMNSNGPFLLKMVFPTSLGRRKKKKKSSTTGTCSKVSPRPVIDGDKDKDWWKKRFSVTSGDSENNESSRGSSTSSSSRRKGEFLPGCWNFFYNRNRSKGQIGNR